MARTEERLELARQELQDLKTAYKRTLSAQSWQTKDGESSRSVTNVSLAELSKQIQAKQKEVDMLEDRLEGRSSGAFRVGVKW